MKTSEDIIQITFIDWCKKQSYILAVWHIANERSTSLKQGAYLKRKGVLAGVWDIWLILNNGTLAVIEFKCGDNKLSEAQKKFEKVLNVANIPHKVCYSSFEAVEFVKSLL